jgi:hypothetical protein
MFIRTADSLSPCRYLTPTPASKWWSVVSIFRQTLTGDRRFESRLLLQRVYCELGFRRMKKCRVLDAARKRAWRPEPAHEPLPPQNVYEPPRAALARRRGPPSTRTLIEIARTGGPHRACGIRFQGRRFDSNPRSPGHGRGFLLGYWRVAGLRHRRGPDHSHRKQCCSRQSDDLAAGPRPNFVAATPRRDEKSRQRTEHPIKSTKLNSREVGNARNGRDDDRCDYG